MRVILSGGGTGGHIYPAIAIADEIKRRYPDAEILFVGAQGRMEMERVPKAGYPIKGLWISGLQRKLSWRNLIFPLKVISSMYGAYRILSSFAPDVVIGTGGYASGPLLKVAQMKGIPNVIQEQNSYAGITNKWLAKKANRICVAYDHMDRFFPSKNIVKTGNPIRKSLVETNLSSVEALAFFSLEKSPRKLLVLGGSLGAKAINELIVRELPLMESLGVTLLWQCGKMYYDQYKKYDNGTTIRVFPFIDRMDYAYSVADVIISRSGASSVSELCVVGKPVIFIPSPNVAEDHQTKNAQALSEKNAAIMIKESRLGADFRECFSELIQNSEKQAELSENIKQLALPSATKTIVDEVEKLIKKL